MPFKWTLPLVAAAAFLLVLALVADPALAAPAETAPSDVGKNFGDFIRDNFKEIAISIAGVIGIAAIAKRDVVLGLVLVGVTILILGFFIKPSPYQTVGQEFLNTVFGATIGLR